MLFLFCASVREMRCKTPTPTPHAVSQEEGIVEKETPATSDDKVKGIVGTAREKAKAATNWRSLAPSNMLILPDAIGAGRKEPPKDGTTKDVEGAKEKEHTFPP